MVFRHWQYNQLSFILKSYKPHENCLFASCANFYKKDEIFSSLFHACKQIINILLETLGERLSFRGFMEVGYMKST